MANSTLNPIQQPMLMVVYRWPYNKNLRFCSDYEVVLVGGPAHTAVVIYAYLVSSYVHTRYVISL